ncbi:MAG: Asp-tRNA(Asn)/Glu-tRNA(Gln) amidotransferase GatCAB subunit A [Flavobacteriales bacterium]|nr:Asp-tRNA(Asn)/Glu-tRNA(Gln) amidotransferase GatCAB subunit A [Flavobacteriales bacterium]
MVLKNYYSFKDIQGDLCRGEITCQKLVQGYLDNISKHSKLNAFVEVYKEESIKRAKEIDSKIIQKKSGKLAGLVIGIKDNICYKNHECSAASKILKGFKSPYSATVIKRVLAEDAIILGRLNCDEFAMGSSNENSIYGPTRNPINIDFVPGGSSGASASAVKANLCQIALGSDTGGSIRQPSAFCGTIGLKPTYGLVSRHGLIAYASSFDQIGPIAKSIYDIKLIMNIISGQDEFDSTCSAKDFASQKTLTRKKRKFAVLKEAIEFKGINPGIKNEFTKMVDSLRLEGHQISYISLPLLEYLVPCYYILTTAEASSNLSRYDGVKYGYQHNDGLISTTRSKGFGKEVKRRILLGTYVLSEGYYEDFYIKAQKIRRLVQKQTNKILSKHDYILLPTTPNLPFKIGDKNISPVQRYYEDVFTVHANLSGHPALSFPLGEVEGGFRASAQIIGNFFSEKDILNTTENVI